MTRWRRCTRHLHSNDWLLNTLGGLEAIPTVVLVGAALAATALITAVDVGGTGTSEFRLFYVIPAFVLTWQLGRRAGTLIAVASLTIELVIDITLTRHQLNSPIAYLPEAVRFALFLIVVEFTAEAKTLVDRETNLARTDQLTGLLNKRGILETGSTMCKLAHRRQAPLAVLYADLDGLKALNDSYGHVTGDEALREFAHVIVAALRASDEAGRVGGDEFVILLPDTTETGAGTVLATISRHLAERANATGLNFTASIGVAIGHPPADIDTLLAAADRAMYQRKQANQDPVQTPSEPRS